MPETEMNLSIIFLVLFLLLPWSLNNSVELRKAENLNLQYVLFEFPIHFVLTVHCAAKLLYVEKYKY